MARMPGVEWAGEHGTSRMSRYDIVCIHTIVGYAPAHAAHFSTSMDGHIWQSRDTAYTSAANLNGNYRIIAIENADYPPAWATSDGHAVPGFSDPQIEAIAQVVAWACTTHGIPIVACPDSRSSSRGVAYHRQGIDGNFSSYAYPGRVEGGELWTSSPGKVCPGDRRIQATLEQIIPRAIEIAGGAAPLGAALTNEEMTGMIVAQCKEDGTLWTISDNTRLEWPSGGGTPGDIGHGNVYASQLLMMMQAAYPKGPAPDLVAIDKETLQRFPYTWQQIDGSSRPDVVVTKHGEKAPPAG